MKRNAELDDPDLFVIACKHVIDGTRDVLLASRAGGDWQFTCGADDHRDEHDAVAIHAYHINEIDPSLLELRDLPINTAAERPGKNKKWVRFPDTE